MWCPRSNPRPNEWATISSPAATYPFLIFFSVGSLFRGKPAFGTFAWYIMLAVPSGLVCNMFVECSHRLESTASVFSVYNFLSAKSSYVFIWSPILKIVILSCVCFSFLTHTLIGKWQGTILFNLILLRVTNVWQYLLSTFVMTEFHRSHD